MYKTLVNTLVYSKSEFSVNIKQYNQIEKQNNINVFGYEKKQPFPIYISKEKSNDHWNLILINDDKKQNYMLIKDLNKFIYNQTKHKENKILYVLTSMFCLEDVCMVVNGQQAIKMPQKGEKIMLKNYHKQLQSSLVIYALLQSITERSTKLSTKW